MPMIKGKLYNLSTPETEWLFRTIFPDLDPDAKCILISSEGMMTFQETPPSSDDFSIRIPHFVVMSYYDLEFEDE